MGFWYTYKDLFVILISAISAITSIVVAIFTYKNLRELKIARIEESRAYIVFYISKHSNNIFYDLVIKNFGKSSGKILSISLDPPLNYSKCNQALNFPVITECKNIHLAPNQSISSSFDFRNYPDKVFNVNVKYETLGRIYEENYQIDYSFRKSVISTKPKLKEPVEVLASIRDSIESLYETLR